MRVLQISMAETFRGAEKFELELFKSIYNEVSFDFLNPNNVFGKYEKEIVSLNGKVYNLKTDRNSIKGKILYVYRLFKHLKKEKYDVVHINSSAFLFSFHVSAIAKICRVKKIIVHSHSAKKLSKSKVFIKKILNPIYVCLADEYLSCSEDASKLLFTDSFINKNKVKIIKNGIDIEKFRYKENVREKYIKKFNLENKIAYGHVGAFGELKNHNFLIDLFYEIQKKQKNSVLLLIGDGKLKEKILQKINELGISEKVIFLGYRDDVNDILNCIDIFIFPSLSEGLGIVAIEAQTNGIVTFCSNNIPKETNISDKFRRFSLNEKISDISNRIISEKIDSKSRKDYYKNTIEKGYDIKQVGKELLNIYKS